jgi:cytochrome c
MEKKTNRVLSQLQIRRKNRRRKVVGLIVAAVTVIFVSILTVQAVSPDDAKALAEKATAYWKANDKDKALAEINNPQGQFVKGDVYVVAHDFKGNVLAHGANPKLVGANLLEQEDPITGNFFVKEQVELAKTKGSGWINLHWTNPTTKKVQPKKSWVKKIEGEDYLVNCGVYE